MAVDIRARHSDALGQVLEKLPFSRYHVAIIAAVSLTGFIEAYATAATGPLVALTKKQMHLPPGDVRWLVIAPTVTLVLAMLMAGVYFCDRFSRKTVLLVGLVWSTAFTSLTSLATTPDSLIVLRLVSGLGMGLALPAAYPIGAELMPAARRKTFAWMYELSLGLGLTVTAVMGYLAGRIHIAESWRIIPMPAIPCLLIGTALIVAFVPESPRWLLTRGRPATAADVLRRIAQRAGDPQAAEQFLSMTQAELAQTALELQNCERCLPVRRLMAPGMRRPALLGVALSICIWTPFYILSTLLPDILVSRGFTVVRSLSLVIVLFAVTIPGKYFNAWIMERLGRQASIALTFLAGVPGIIVAITVKSTAGALLAEVLLGLTVLSIFPSARMFVVEIFPTEFRGRGNFLAEMSGRFVAGIPIPFLLAGELSSGKLASPGVIFATAGVFMVIGALLPLVAGTDTRGTLEHVETRVTGRLGMDSFDMEPVPDVVVPAALGEPTPRGTA